MFISGWWSGWWYLISLALAVWAAWWTYRDAAARGMLAWLWSALSLIIFPLGWIVYLIVRAFTKPKSEA